MKCKNCGRHLNSDREDCPNCGEPIVYKLEKSHNVPMMIIAAALTVATLVIAIYVLSDSSDFKLTKNNIMDEMQSVDSFEDQDDSDDWLEEFDEYEQISDDTSYETESETVIAEAEAYEEQTYEEESFNSEDIRAEGIIEFYQNYRWIYSESLNDLDFDIVAPYLSPNGTAYGEMYNYIEEIRYDGYHFQLHDNRVRNYTISGGVLYLKAYEAFDLTDQNGKTTSHQRDKDYTIIMDGDDPLFIDSIKITNHYR